MKTLIVNCYPNDADKKIEPYVQLVNRYSEYKIEKDGKLHKDYDISEYDAVLLSGSPYLISLGEYSRQFLAFIQNLKIPTLGICYGHQMLAFAYGAEIKSGEKIEGYKRVKLLESSRLFLNLEKEILVAESHQEFVVLETLPRTEFVLTAESDSCAVEAIRHSKLPIYGTQFHFERSGEIGERIMANFYNNVVKRHLRQKC